VRWKCFTRSRHISLSCWPAINENRPGKCSAIRPTGRPRASTRPRARLSRRHVYLAGPGCLCLPHRLLRLPKAVAVGRATPTASEPDDVPTWKSFLLDGRAASASPPTSHPSSYTLSPGASPLSSSRRYPQYHSSPSRHHPKVAGCAVRPRPPPRSTVPHCSPRRWQVLQ
jgi:hypothetical protein